MPALLDVQPFLGAPRDEAPVNTMARGLTGSEILKIAGEVRALLARGEQVCNLTVGDFSPQQFPIPEQLGRWVSEALANGETNYPPADGVPALRQAILKNWERDLGLSYPLDGVVVASGARPIIYGVYRAVVEAGETVVFPAPSWNNNHYAHMMGAKSVVVPTRAEDGFMPGAAQLAPHLKDARLLSLCTPLNPTGTMITAEQLDAICTLVLDENARRKADGRRPLLVLFDQIYRSLTFSGLEHLTPVHRRPEMAEYTLFVDGISKAFAATGLRVGWGLGPPSVIARMRDVLGHVGAWAPKAEQIATAKWLDDAPAVDAYLTGMRAAIRERLDLLHEGFQGMASRGLPVRSIAPQGAIYLSAQISLPGRSSAEVRKLLLEQARFAVVPFSAFGQEEDTGWHRLSVGAVGVQELREALPRVEAALRAAL